MEMHNNVDVTTLFRTMADVERKHARYAARPDGLEHGAGRRRHRHGPRGAEGPETVGER